MTTKIVFRTWKKGDVIALFPRIPADRQGYKCQSYMHIGQHAAADPSGVVLVTKPSTKQEYEPLLRELKSIGYTGLEIGKKITPQDNAARQKMADKQWGKLK